MNLEREVKVQTSKFIKNRWQGRGTLTMVVGRLGTFGLWTLWNGERERGSRRYR